MTDTYFPGRGYRTRDRYGERWGRLHSGVDFGAKEGTPVRAAADGDVIYVGRNGRPPRPGERTGTGFGYTVIVRHKDSAGQTLGYSLSAHMTGEGMPAYGQQIYKGDVIGRVGNTGRSYGPHLHYSWINSTTPVARSATGGPVNFDPQDEKGGFTTDPFQVTDYGPSGVYHDTGRDLGIIHRTDRFYPRDLAGPLYDSGFTKDPFSTAALVDVTPLYDAQNVRPSDPAPLTQPRPLGSRPGAPATFGERFDPFEPGPPVSNTLGEEFNLLDPRPGAPFQRANPDRRTQYPFGPDRFATFDEPAFGEPTLRQPTMAQDAARRRLAETLARSTMTPPSLMQQPSAPASAPALPPPPIDDTFGYHGENPQEVARRFGENALFPLTRPEPLRKLSEAEDRIVKKALAELAAGDEVMPAATRFNIA